MDFLNQSVIATNLMVNGGVSSTKLVQTAGNWSDCVRPIFRAIDSTAFKLKHILYDIFDTWIVI